MELHDQVSKSHPHLQPSRRKREPRSKCPPLRVERMRAALDAKDPSLADEFEDEFCHRHLGRSLFQAEVQLADMRNVCYERLTPLRATDLFAEEYRETWKCFARGVGGGVECELSGELSGATTPVMKDLWKGRQQADALGMEYDDYIVGLFEMHKKSGLSLPRPSDLHGPSALASALKLLAVNDQEKGWISFPPA